jgi:hypothetical protein
MRRPVFVFVYSCNLVSRVETIQQREGRWVLADLEGKGRRIRTVAIPSGSSKASTPG